MERLARIEKAIYPEGQVPDLPKDYDARLLMLLEQVVIHVGVLEEAHNALAHTVRMKKEPPQGVIIRPSL